MINDNRNFWAIMIAVIVIAIFTVFILSGCVSTDSVPVVITTPTQKMLDVVAKTDWFGTFCLLSFFGGIVAIGLDQRKIGGAIVIAAIATICLGLAIHRFPLWLAIIGFTGSIIGAGYSILIKNKALIQIIKGVQNYKNIIDSDVRIGKNLSIQSDSTKRIVKKVKEKL